MFTYYIWNEYYAREVSWETTEYGKCVVANNIITNWFGLWNMEQISEWSALLMSQIRWAYVDITNISFVTAQTPWRYVPTSIIHSHVSLSRTLKTLILKLVYEYMINREDSRTRWQRNPIHQEFSRPSYSMAVEKHIRCIF